MRRQNKTIDCYLDIWECDRCGHEDAAEPERYAGFANRDAPIYAIIERCGDGFRVRSERPLGWLHIDLSTVCPRCARDIANENQAERTARRG